MPTIDSMRLSAGRINPKPKWQLVSHRRRSAAASAAATSKRAGGDLSKNVTSDFDPTLRQGVIGAAGIRFRINQAGFQYANSLLGSLIGSQIRQARIPPISQCLPKVQGCLNVYNLQIENFGCPRNIALNPAPPNRLALSVQNFDLAVSGQLGGQITVVEPIAIFGTIHFSARQITIAVEIAIEQGGDGRPFVRVTGCRVNIGDANFYIENGGTLGQLANSLLRKRIANQVRKLVPSRVCAQLPSIVNDKINAQLHDLPNGISAEKIARIAAPALGIDISTISGGARARTQPSSPRGARGKLSPPRSIGFRDTIMKPSSTSLVKYYTPKKTGFIHRRRISRDTKEEQIARQFLRLIEGVTSSARAHAVHTYELETSGKLAVINSTAVVRSTSNKAKGSNATAESALSHSNDSDAESTTTASDLDSNSTSELLTLHDEPGINVTSTDTETSTMAVSFDLPSTNSSGNATKSTIDPVKEILKNIDIRKLRNQILSLKVLRTEATFKDFTVDLSGEFSENARGGTPFGPAPLQMPNTASNKMAELLVSDYVVNSLLFQMHKKGFFMFTVGPETPAIGQLLRTTCSEDDELLDDASVQIDEETSTAARAFAKRRSSSRQRRQADSTNLNELGICAGDILPAIREKYPKRNLSIVFNTKQAPSIQLSGKGGGLATIKLIADAAIFVVGETPKKSVGTISIQAGVELTPKIAGTHISGSAKITELNLTDATGELGLPQDALDNLSNLSKEFLQKMANDVLGKGVDIKLPSTGLPIQFRDPQLKVLEHAIYVAIDFTVSPELLGGSGGASGGGGC